MKKTKSKILIIDDIKANVRLLSKYLSNDYEILTAYNGKEAIEIASKENPDLILLDIILPDIDGYEVCKKLKSDKKTCEIPIVFVTTLDEIEDEAKGLQLGAIDYLIKPFRIPILKARIANHIALKLSIDKQEKLIEELQKALTEVKTLSGLLPICASCKKIRDDHGYWNQVEIFIAKHSDVDFSHSLCPECAEKMYGNQGWFIEMKKNLD